MTLAGLSIPQPGPVHEKGIKEILLGRSEKDATFVISSRGSVGINTIVSWIIATFELAEKGIECVEKEPLGRPSDYVQLETC